MGNYFTSQDNNLEERIKKLQDNTVTKEELSKYLSGMADKNSDGVITRDELESYVQSQLNTKKEEAEKEIEKWKQAYDNLYEKYSELQRKYHDGDKPKDIEKCYVSIHALEQYIESEIINSDANLKYVPDALERKAYLAVYKTVMKSLEGLCNTTTIDLMNHELTFNLKPKPVKD